MEDYKVQICQLNEDGTYNNIFPIGDLQIMFLQYTGTGSGNSKIYLPNNNIMPLMIQVCGNKKDSGSSYEINVNFKMLTAYNKVKFLKQQGSSEDYSYNVLVNGKKLLFLGYNYSIIFYGFGTGEMLENPTIEFNKDSSFYNIGMQIDSSNQVIPYNPTILFDLNTEGFNYQVCILYTLTDIGKMFGIE